MAPLNRVDTPATPTRPTIRRRHVPINLSRILRSLNRDPARARAAKVREVDRAIDLCRALLSERGEVSGARVAAEVLSAYQQLDDEQVECFLDRLVTAFSVDPEAVRQAADAYRLDASPANLLALQEAVEPPRQELFRRWNMAPGGTAVLVDMRRRLLRTLGDHPDRAEIDADLTHLFRSWFNRGFLTLQRIDWQTSAVILERLIQYEAVHQIQGWRDLRRRLEVGSPLLCVLPSRAAAGAADLHRGRVDAQRDGAGAAAARPGLAGRRSRACHVRDVLLDHQLPAGTPGRVVRQRPHQAGRRGPGQGVSARQDLCHAVAHSRISRVAPGTGGDRAGLDLTRARGAGREGRRRHRRRYRRRARAPSRAR